MLDDEAFDAVFELNSGCIIAFRGFVDRFRIRIEKERGFVCKTLIVFFFSEGCFILK